MHKDPTIFDKKCKYTIKYIEKIPHVYAIKIGRNRPTTWFCGDYFDFSFLKRKYNTLMTYVPEIEFKFFPSNLDEVLKNLETLAVKTHERRLMRAAIFRREDNPHFRDMDIIRVRDEGDAICIAMKQRWVDGVELDHCLERELTVESFESSVAMFSHLGNELSGLSEKYRTTWELDDCEIVLDENPWLEPYIEIEWPSENSIRSLCERIGCAWDTRRDGGTRILYIEKYGEHARMVRNITFTENPFLL
jgi:adenylate cyclase class 2